MDQRKPGSEFLHDLAEGARDLGREAAKEAPHVIREVPHVVEALQAVAAVQAASLVPLQQAAAHVGRHGRRVAVGLACCTALGGGGYAVSNHHPNVPVTPTSVISPLMWNPPSQPWSVGSP